MKTLTDEEFLSAFKKTPAPVRDFSVSPTLMNIYAGLRKKHSLTFRESWILSQLVTLCLLEIERESAFETNLHQELPEISHAKATELVNDISTRIFKESKRRVAENILEPSTFSEIREPDPSFAEYNRINNLLEDDPEKIQMRAKEQAELEAERSAFEEKLKLAESVATKSPTPENETVDLDYTPVTAPIDPSAVTSLKSSYEEETEAIDKEFDELAKTADKEKLGLPDTTPKPVVPLPTTPITPPKGAGLPIAQQKLSKPIITSSNDLVAEPLTDTSENSGGTIPAPQTKIGSIQKKRVDGVDPYRETPE